MGLVSRFATTGWGAKLWSALMALVTAVLLAPVALAAEPREWELGLQPAASPVRERIDTLHDALLIIITLISIFVLGLLLYVILRFNARRNPMPSKTSHNTLLEVLWTAVPILILLGIAIPSFKLLYYVDRAQKADMTLKVTGHQWYWTYEYPDQGNITFDSNMIPEDKIQPGQKRLLDVDNQVVVPVGTTIRILVAGTDVIHSWFVPSVGVQEYAVVGRTNESWMLINEPGTYYGQCNQICGLNHPFMPIAIKAVPKDEFDQWVVEAKKKFAHDDEQRDGNHAAPRLVAQAAQ
jgi:cytochrome c oxidase subunit II